MNGARAARAGGRLSGRRLCGAVAFRLERRDLNEVAVCHCSQCRRWSGRAWASVSAPRDGLDIVRGEAALKWRRSSDFARRGFCGEGVGALFWHRDGLEDPKHRIDVAMGVLDAPTGLRLGKHVFVADKGDYDDIADGLPQKATE